MKTRYLLTILGIALLAIPAAVPASQPAGVKLVDLAPAVPAAPVAEFSTLLADPYTTGDLSIVLPTGFTTLAWIDENPFKG